MAHTSPSFSYDTRQEWNASRTGSPRDSDSEITLLGDEMADQSLKKSIDDIESQSFSVKDAGSSPVAAEYRVTTRKKMTYLGVYFLLNLGLTLYNKALLGNVGSQILMMYLRESNS
jgi:hypothetical protein